MASATRETTTINKDSFSHLEDLTIVWLDVTIDSNNIIWSKRQSILRSCINYIRTFTDKDDCLKYISTIRDERIFLIASGSMGEIIVPDIHDLPQIYGIYIFCSDIVKHNQWSKSFSKIHGVFDDENHLIVCLENDAKIYPSTLMPISIGHSNERSLQDIDEEQVAFLWFQLLIEVICRLPQTSKSRKEMSDECRTHYADNLAQLRIIDEFYNEYTRNLAINWYTKDCFLYRLLNKAFRTQNIDIIFNYHYFLSDLTKELTRLYQTQFGDNTGTLTVYRGQRMHIGELQRLQSSIGRLVSINTFFSTTTSCIVAANFSGNGEHRSEGIESIVLQLEIDLSIQRRPFGKIDQLSSNKDEHEILFAMGSVFRIKSIELFSDNIWFIVLTLTDEVKKEVEDLLAYFTKNIGTQPSLLELGVLLSKNGDFERAKHFYLRLQNELPENHSDLGVLYNNLGEIYRQQGHLDNAMLYYKMAIDELTESFGFLDPWFAIVYSNIAMVYDARRQFDQALIHYRCALFILEHYRDCEGELFSTIYNGMATIFQQKGQPKSALTLYEKTLKIELRILPSGHPSIATTYNNIGQLYFQMKDNSKALENLLKALPIMLSTLPDNHPQLARLYAGIGPMYILQNQISKGIEHLLKAEQTVDRSTLTSDHNLREEIYRTLAVVSRKNKIIDLSIRMHQKLIDVFKARTPPDQYAVAYWTDSLADVFIDQRDRHQAFQYRQLALNIIQQLPRTERNKHLYTIIINAFWSTEYFDIAVEHNTRLLNEETNTESVFAAKLHNNLGAAYDHMDNSVLAIKHYREALRCYVNWPDSFAQEIAITHYNIGVILHYSADYEDARNNVCKALSFLSEIAYYLRSQCHFLLGQTYRESGDLTHTREYFHNAIELAMREDAPNHKMINTYTHCWQQVIDKIEKNTLTNLESIKEIQ